MAIWFSGCMLVTLLCTVHMICFKLKWFLIIYFITQNHQFGHNIFFDFKFLSFEPFIIFGYRFAFEGVHKRRYTNVWGILTILLGMFLPWTWCGNAQMVDTVQIPIFVDTCTNLLLILLQTSWALNCFHSKNCCVWWQNVIGFGTVLRNFPSNGVI